MASRVVDDHIGTVCERQSSTMAFRKERERRETSFQISYNVRPAVAVGRTFRIPTRATVSDYTFYTS